MSSCLTQNNSIFLCSCFLFWYFCTIMLCVCVYVCGLNAPLSTVKIDHRTTTLPRNCPRPDFHLLFIMCLCMFNNPGALGIHSVNQS